MKKKEESFSVFKFDSSNHAVDSMSAMINGTGFGNANTTVVDDDDDDWGDFNFVSSNSIGLNHTLSLPRISKTGLDVAGLRTQPGSAPSRVNDLTHWEKPKGALPLSIFGEIEEQEEEEKDGSGAGELTKSSFDFAKNSKKSERVNVNDLIANLYKEKEKNNGIGSNDNGWGLNLEKTGGGIQRESNWNWGNLNRNELNSNGVNKEEFDSKGLNLDSNTNGFHSNEVELDLVKKKGNLNESRVDLGLVNGNEEFGDDDDDDGWEFKVAETKADIEREMSKSENNKSENKLVSSVNGLNTSWNARDLNFNGWNSNINGTNASTDWLNMSSVEGFKGLGSSDGWGFKDMDPKTQIGDENAKGERTKTEIKPTLSLDGSNSSWNMFSSNGQGNSNLNEVNSDSKQMNLNSLGEIEDFAADNEWEFKAVESESGGGEGNVNGEQTKTEIKPILSFDGSNSRWNMFSSNGEGPSNLNEVNSDTRQMNLNSLGENEDFGGDDEWEFKVAESESGAGEGNAKGEQIKTEIKLTLSLDGSNSSWNMLSKDGLGNSNLNEANSDTKQMNLNSLVENEDFEGGDEWEFKTAESESGAGEGNAKGGGRRDENSEQATYASGIDSVTVGRIDLFGTSQGTSLNSSEWDFGFDFSSCSLTQDATVSSTYSKSEQNATKNSLYSSPDVEKADASEEPWTFKDAFSENGLKEVPNVAEASVSVKEFAFDGQRQGNMARSISHKEVLPLSFFGVEEEEDANDTVSYQDIPLQMPSSKPIDGFNGHGHSKISINDLISSLYSQAEQNIDVDHGQNSNGNALSHTDTGIGSNLESENNDFEGIVSNLASENGDFEDDSWEFKDASSGTRAEDQASDVGLGEPHANNSSKVELSDYVDFFCKLKEELQFVALCHLDSLKKARSAASEDADVKALDMEIQNLHNELHQDGLISGEFDSGNHSSRNFGLNEFVEVFREPKFQVFDAEYELSNKLSLVENDLRSTMQPLKLMASTIKILSLVSMEEQAIYVSAWSKILSVCSQELKHGSHIWKQALQKNIHEQILSKSQGKNYILALGEIYRVIEVIGSSARLYKPWLLASSTDAMGLFTLLTECSTLWSSSGLEEALQSISGPVCPDYNGGFETLTESIKCIHDLDSCSLYDHVFSGQGPICRLSVLTMGAVPGMKTVVWNGEYYFLTLANLWANLISCDPPNLPHVHVG